MDDDRNDGGLEKRHREMIGMDCDELIWRPRDGVGVARPIAAEYPSSFSSISVHFQSGRSHLKVGSTVGAESVMNALIHREMALVIYR